MLSCTPQQACCGVKPLHLNNCSSNVCASQQAGSLTRLRAYSCSGTKGHHGAVCSMTTPAQQDCMHDGSMVP